MYSLGDTIAAVSSPPGRSLRGLVRISGPRASDILTRLTAAALPPPRTLAPAHLLLSPPSSSLSLPALAAWFAAPHSYTGDDLVELQLPGNPALLDRLLQHILALGARLAEPGEFTFRAYAGGKIDLTQAEGVAATIAAVSDAQLHAAGMLRDGRLGGLARALADALADLLAAVEAGIDFTDQDGVVSITPAQLADGLAGLSGRLAGLLASSRSWARLDAIPRVVLAGPPSAGKSSLFNALLGRARSVVSPLPGTTRDILAEPLTLRLQSAPGGAPSLSLEILLLDIAGLDEPRSALDRQVQQSARAAVAQADLILQLSPVPSQERMAGVADILLIQSKADLPGFTPAPGALPVSAHTGQGLAELRHAIAQRLAGRASDLSGQALALQPRHESALRSAGAHLDAAGRLLESQAASQTLDRPELLAASLRAALDDLAHLAGQMTPDDVIGRVFAKFCIGK